MQTDIFECIKISTYLIILYCASVMCVVVNLFTYLLNLIVISTIDQLCRRATGPEIRSLYTYCNIMMTCLPIHHPISGIKVLVLFVLFTKKQKPDDSRQQAIDWNATASKAMTSEPTTVKIHRLRFLTIFSRTMTSDILTSKSYQLIFVPNESKL